MDSERSTGLVEGKISCPWYKTMNNPRTFLTLYKSWGCLYYSTGDRINVYHIKQNGGGGGRNDIVWCTCIYRAYTSACNDYTFHDICTQIQQNIENIMHSCNGVQRTGTGTGDVYKWVWWIGEVQCSNDKYNAYYTSEIKVQELNATPSSLSAAPPSVNKCRIMTAP